MCEPTLIITGIVATGALSMYGIYQQGQSQSAMYRYQANLANQEAKLKQQRAEQEQEALKQDAESNVSAVMTTAADESQRLFRDVSELSGAQKAAMGAMGIGGTTAEAITKDTFDKSTLDQMAIRYNANVRAWDINEKAKRGIWTSKEEAKSSVWALGAEAGQYRMAASNARRQAGLSMAKTLLSTATQAGYAKMTL